MMLHSIVESSVGIQFTIVDRSAKSGLARSIGLFNSHGHGGLNSGWDMANCANYTSTLADTDRHRTLLSTIPMSLCVCACECLDSTLPFRSACVTASKPRQLSRCLLLQLLMLKQEEVKNTLPPLSSHAVRLGHPIVYSNCRPVYSPWCWWCWWCVRGSNSAPNVSPFGSYLALLVFSLVSSTQTISDLFSKNTNSLSIWFSSFKCNSIFIYLCLKSDLIDHKIVYTCRSRLIDLTLFGQVVMETTDRSDLFMRNIPKKMATSHLQLCLVSFDFHVLVCVCVCVCASVQLQIFCFLFTIIVANTNRYIKQSKYMTNNINSNNSS